MLCSDSTTCFRLNIYEIHGGSIEGRYQRWGVVDFVLEGAIWGGIIGGLKGLILLRCGRAVERVARVTQGDIAVP